MEQNRPVCSIKKTKTNQQKHLTEHAPDTPKQSSAQTFILFVPAALQCENRVESASTHPRQCDVPGSRQSWGATMGILSSILCHHTVPVQLS